MNGNNIFYFDSAEYPKGPGGHGIQLGQLMPVGNRLFQVLSVEHMTNPAAYRTHLVELVLILEQVGTPSETTPSSSIVTA